MRKEKPLNIILVGGQDRGKSARAKSILKKNPLPRAIYDINGEYTGTKYAAGMDSFLDQVKQKRHTAIVFEEATIFFSSKGRSEEIIEMLVKHNGNIQLFCFHSLRSVPTYIIELCHYLILFKTKDNPTSVLQKYKDYPEIIQAYNEVQASNIGTCQCKESHPAGFHYSKEINIEP